jgi:hypothetical protein
MGIIKIGPAGHGRVVAAQQEAGCTTGPRMPVELAQEPSHAWLFGNVSYGPEGKIPLGDKDVTASIEVES